MRRDQASKLALRELVGLIDSPSDWAALGSRGALTTQASLPAAAPNREKAVGSRPFRNAPGTIRTCDLPLRRRTLYPLSYGRLGGLGRSGTVSLMEIAILSDAHPVGGISFGPLELG